METVRITESGHGYVAHIAGFGTVILTADQCEELGIASIDEAFVHIRNELWINHRLEVVRADS